MKLAFVLYDQFTALDLTGPVEVLSRWPGAEAQYVASSRDPVSSDAGLRVLPTATYDDLPDPDLVLVPGSARPFGPLSDERLLAWVASAAGSARWMTSVCTGSSILAAAGLLRGRRATTHWAFRDAVREMGVDVVTDRVVFDDPFVTAGGVSAGIDMALRLTAHVHGEAAARRAQLILEYDPQPPFDSGSPETADAATVEGAIKSLAAAMGADQSD